MVMAEIFTRCGRYDDAIDELANVLSLESGYSANSVKLLHWVDPLRDLPRFQALLKEFESTASL